ncbi:hypothetical protein MAPG_00329 [Magnaporthiopsis poae ATCC 64411]|uniref:Uncharacterized protein n=1 Tax=Magnaporthiopsis poae (strain ATCC 64411 / 73-15) TaxID=644358 RepID=A0A0C4DKQ1_MAGP6|nr:hypothetical protein MAPG_00329 [Magnaporthiopsis poae ATCC 64411]
MPLPSAPIDSLAQGQGDSGVIPEPASENPASQLRSKFDNSGWSDDFGPATGAGHDDNQMTAEDRELLELLRISEEESLFSPNDAAQSATQALVRQSPAHQSQLALPFSSETVQTSQSSSAAESNQLQNEPAIGSWSGFSDYLKRRKIKVSIVPLNRGACAPWGISGTPGVVRERRKRGRAMAFLDPDASPTPQPRKKPRPDLGDGASARCARPAAADAAPGRSTPASNTKKPASQKVRQLGSSSMASQTSIPKRSSQFKNSDKSSQIPTAIQGNSNGNDHGEALPRSGMLSYHEALSEKGEHLRSQRRLVDGSGDQQRQQPAARKGVDRERQEQKFGDASREQQRQQPADGKGENQGWVQQRAEQQRRKKQYEQLHRQQGQPPRSQPQQQTQPLGQSQQRQQQQQQQLHQQHQHYPQQQQQQHQAQQLASRQLTRHDSPAVLALSMPTPLTPSKTPANRQPSFKNVFAGSTKTESKSRQPTRYDSPMVLTLPTPTPSTPSNTPSNRQPPFRNAFAGSTRTEPKPPTNIITTQSVAAYPQPRRRPAALEIDRAEAIRIMRETRPPQTPSGPVTNQDMRRQVRASDIATRRKPPRRDAEFWEEHERPQAKKWKNRGFVAAGGRRHDNREARDKRNLRKTTDKFCREIRGKFPDLPDDEVQGQATKQAEEWQENLMKKREAARPQAGRSGGGGGGSIIYNYGGEDDNVDDEDGALNGINGRPSAAASLPLGMLPEQDVLVYTVYKTHPFHEGMAGGMGDSHIRVKTFTSRLQANDHAREVFAKIDDPILRGVEAEVDEESIKHNERCGMFWGHRRYADGTIHLVFVDEERVQAGNLTSSHLKGKKLTRRFIDAFAPLRFDVWAFFTDPVVPKQKAPPSAPAQRDSHRLDVAECCFPVPSTQAGDTTVSRDAAARHKRASSAPPVGGTPDKPSHRYNTGCRDWAPTPRQCLPEEAFYTPPKSKQLLYRELVKPLPASLTQSQAEAEMNSSEGLDDDDQQLLQLQPAVTIDSHEDDDDARPPEERTTFYPVHVRAFTTLGDANYHALLTYLSARARGVDVATHQDLTLNLYNRPEYGLALDFRHLCIQVVRTELEGPWPVGQGLVDADANTDGADGEGEGKSNKEWEEWVRQMQRQKRNLAVQESRAEREAGQELQRKRKAAKAANQVKLMQLRAISDALHGIKRRSHQKKKKQPAVAKDDDEDEYDEPGVGEEGGRADEPGGYNEPDESEESESEESEEE